MTRCRGLPAGSVMAGQPNQKSIHAFKHVKLIYQPHALRVCCPYIERIRRFRKSLSLPYTPPGTIQSFRSSLAMRWQGQQGSNPRPAVLETAALPTELYPYRRHCYFIDAGGIQAPFSFPRRCRLGCPRPRRRLENHAATPDSFWRLPARDRGDDGFSPCPHRACHATQPS